MAQRYGTVKIKCNLTPIGDIRKRQPKQPGQKKAEWNRAPDTVPRAPSVVTYGNLCKDGNVRCCLCGNKGHEEV